MDWRGVFLPAALLLTACQPVPPPEVALVEIGGGSVSYQLPGAVLPITEQVAGFAIMQRQVSQAEYAACVSDEACPVLEVAVAVAAPDLPVVGLSWQDAQAYITWLGQRSGVQYRLPRYGEWVLAAGTAYAEDTPVVDDPRNPAQRWLAEYQREALRGPASAELQRFGEQRRNADGVLGMAANVWEWTDSCFGQPAGALDGFCGVRIAAGRHPAALSDFVRDPISGACSVGAPPTHLGLRLVRTL